MTEGPRSGGQESRVRLHAGIFNDRKTRSHRDRHREFCDEGVTHAEGGVTGTLSLRRSRYPEGDNVQRKRGALSEWIYSGHSENASVAYIQAKIRCRKKRSS